MVSTCSCPKKGFFMEQDTSVFDLSLTRRDASNWNNPSLSCVLSSARDGIFSPFASSHCISGWGNHPLPVHFSLIPSSSGPTMKIWVPEPKPGEESHSSETWTFFVLVFHSYTSGRRWTKHHCSLWMEGGSFLFPWDKWVSEVQKLQEHWSWYWNLYQCLSYLLYTSISAIGHRRIIGKEQSKICQCRHVAPLSISVLYLYHMSIPFIGVSRKTSSVLKLRLHVVTSLNNLLLSFFQIFFLPLSKDYLKHEGNKVKWVHERVKIFLLFHSHSFLFLPLLLLFLNSAQARSASRFT